MEVASEPCLLYLRLLSPINYSRINVIPFQYRLVLEMFTIIVPISLHFESHPDVGSFTRACIDCRWARRRRTSVVVRT
jgi:hypothetical protein